MRLFYRLGLVETESEGSYRTAVRIGRRMADSAGVPIDYVDAVLASLGMAHKREANVCRKTDPLCDDCCICDPDASTIMACGVNERLLQLADASVPESREGAVWLSSMPRTRNPRALHSPILCAKCVRTALYGVQLEGIGRQGRYGKPQLDGTIQHALGRDETAKMPPNRTLNQRVRGSSPRWRTTFCPAGVGFPGPIVLPAARIHQELVSQFGRHSPDCGQRLYPVLPNPNPPGP
jgi:hypothetical protein